MKNKRGYAIIALENVKNPINMGSVMRACDCLGATALIICNGRYRKICTDTMKGYRHLPVFHTTDLRKIVPYDCIPIGIEITPDAIELPQFAHPQRAFYIFGAEDGSIKNSTLVWCKYVVKIPTKHCLNLAATVNIILYDRNLGRRISQRSVQNERD